MIEIYETSWRGYFGKIKVIITNGNVVRRGINCNIYEFYIFMPYNSRPIYYYGNIGGHASLEQVLLEVERFIRSYYMKLDPTYSWQVPVEFEVESEDSCDTLRSRFRRPKYCLFPNSLRQITSSRELTDFLQGL